MSFPIVAMGPCAVGVSRLSRRKGRKGAVLRDQQLGEGNVETMEAETRLKSGLAVLKNGSVWFSWDDALKMFAR